MENWSGIDPRIWQAAIAGGVVAVGWLVGGWQTRRAAARARAEKLRDFHRAIFAEIRHALSALQTDPADSARTLQRMRDDPDFVPFVPREHHNQVFSSLIDEIDVLPRQTIDMIVAYYSLMRGVEGLAEDMRGVRFEGLAPDRRIAIYTDFLEMRRNAFRYGELSLALIAAYAEGGAAAAEARERELAINSPDEGPSAR